jgi:hypothetical protein
MGVLILWVTFVAIDLTVRYLRQPVTLPADMLLAARAGLVLLVISCLLGIWVSVYGDMRVAAELEPERYGAAGVPKFPHGAMIHALQWLPMLAWAARRAGFTERWRVSLVVSAGMLLLYANCKPYLSKSDDVLAQFCQLSITFAIAVGILEMASESFQVCMLV